MNKAELIEKYRDFNTEHTEWWECVYSDFKEDMTAVGIEVDQIYFSSGFWSQGDGACFTGCIGDLALYLSHHCTETAYPMIRKLMAAGGYVRFHAYHRGPYYHEYSTQFDYYYNDLGDVLPTDNEMQVLAIAAMQQVLESEVEAFYTEVCEEFRSYMKGLYRKLEAEYEFLTSDEAVWDAIVANELQGDVCQTTEVI